MMDLNVLAYNQRHVHMNTEPVLIESQRDAVFIYLIQSAMKISRCETLVGMTKRASCIWDVGTSLENKQTFRNVSASRDIQINPSMRRLSNTAGVTVKWMFEGLCKWIFMKYWNESKSGWRDGNPSKNLLILSFGGA